MKILFLYTKRMMSANKARTSVTFIGIVLSFTLLTAILTATSSLLHFMTEFMKVRDGDYYGVIYNCSEADEKRLIESSEVTQSVRMGLVGIADRNSEIKMNYQKNYIAIGSVDVDYFDEMGVKVLEGRLPQNDSEILIPQMMTTNSKEMAVGNTITWQIGKRIGSDGRVIAYQKVRCEDQDSEDGYEKETIQVQQTKTYTIVGISTNPGYVSIEAPYFLVLTTGEQTTLSDLYFKINSIDDVSAFVNKNFSDHDWAINETLLRYLGRSTSYIRYAMYGLCAVFGIVIVITSAALIYNAFSISLTERTRQFGLLKSIGATRTQIILSVFFEVASLSLTAIPAGLLIGCVGVKLVLYLLKDSFAEAIRSAGEAYAQSVTITFYTQIWYLVVAVVVGLLTIFVSAMIPAIRAGKIAPIEAIRQTNDIKNIRVPKRIRKNGVLEKLFGVGGMIAHRNAKRNRKAYRAISFSLAICLFLFLGGSGFLYYMRLSMKGIDVLYYYDYHILFGNQYNETIDPAYRTQEFHREIANQLNETSSINEAIYIRKANLSITAGESDLTDVGKLALGEYIENGKLNYKTDIYFVEETQYERYLNELGFDPSDYLRSDNPKLLILNFAKGAADLENGQRRFYEGAIFQNPSKLSDISIIGIKKIKGAKYAYQDPNDETKMIYVEGDVRSAKTEDDLKTFTVPIEDSIENIQLEVGACVQADEYPYWAWAGNWVFVLPLGALPEDSMIDVYTNDYVYMTANDSARALEQIIQLQNKYTGAFQAGMPSQNNMYEYSMLRIFQICLLCFLVLIILISLANIANTITTAVRLRTREYAMIRSVGCSKRTFLGMIAAENLSYMLRGFAIGSLMGGVANYVSYHYVKDAIYTNHIIPFFLYGIGAVAFLLMFVFSTAYTWKKVQKGQICEELRRDAF